MKKYALATAAAVLMLAGCGGGGAESFSTPTAACASVEGATIGFSMGDGVTCYGADNAPLARFHRGYDQRWRFVAP